jgi:hypothetical protein
MKHINVNGDPKIVGPGVWFTIHIQAKEAVTNHKIEQFIQYMELLARQFGCMNCRKHIRSYIDNHPINDFRTMTNEKGDRIGMFKWSWMFHNAVNTRINKPYLEWDTAWEMYNSDNSCNDNCAASDNEIHKVDKIEETDLDSNYSLVSRNENVINEIRKSPINKVEKLHYNNDLDRKSKLAQSYFMSIGIPDTLNKYSITTH